VILNDDLDDLDKIIIYFILMVLSYFWWIFDWFRIRFIKYFV